MQTQQQEEMFPRKKADPNQPPTWLKLEHVVGLFIIGLVVTIIFNGF